MHYMVIVIVISRVLQEFLSGGLTQTKVNMDCCVQGCIIAYTMHASVIYVKIVLVSTCHFVPLPTNVGRTLLSEL